MQKDTMQWMNLAWAAVAMICLVGCAQQQPKAATKQPEMMSAPAFTWGDFPATATPRVAGKKVAENLLARPEMEARNYGVIYPEVCVGYGAMRFANAIGDKPLLDKLVERYDGMLVQGDPPAPPRVQGGGWWIKPENGTAATMIPTATHVDRSVFGTLAFESFLVTKNPAYAAIGKKSADDQWANPIEGGLTNQSRFWIDDMFMITSLQVQAYRGTKDMVYLDRAATEMAAYLDRMQLPNGLFYHRDDVKFIWGRGDGWVAAGLAELLTDLPKEHPKYARIMDGYKKLMAGLLPYLTSEGTWRQVIDQPDSWPESSGTGMFVYSMATGVKRGWLDAATYKEPVKKAWIGLCGFLNEDGNVRDVSVGTNAIATNTLEFYNSRTRAVGDKHGQAAFIWAAYAMLE